MPNETAVSAVLKVSPTSSGLVPRIAISCGDLNGIGLEVILKTLSDKRIAQQCTPVVFASKKVVDFYIATLPEDLRKEAQLEVINTLEDLPAGKAYLFPAWEEEVTVQPGQLTEAAGKYAVRSLQVSAQALKDGLIDGLVTAPLHKGNTRSEDFPYTGHTPFLKNFFSAKEGVMMLHDDKLRIALATEHIPLAAVPAALTQYGLAHKLGVVADALIRDFGVDKPRIAVLGLNPHAGDGGEIGKEEETIIAPAIEDAKRAGILAFGPYPADAFFARASYRHFDAVFALYHDQGLIPLKTLAGGRGVNYTAGLPVIRTSPDHGTAFDIAGQGIADPDSFREALFNCIDRIWQRQRYAENGATPLPRTKSQRERGFGG
jgi:4-hydroxythreonine-4-phosphate dehydrogenase